MKLKGLQFRIMVTMLTVAALFAAAAGVVTYQLGYQRALAGGRATLEGLLTSVEKTVAIGAYTSDKVLLQEVLDGLARNTLIARVEVRSPSGEVVVFKQSDDSLHAADNSPDRQVVTHRLASPFDAKEAVGQVRIDADMTRLHASARAEASLLALVMVGQTVLLATLLYVMAERLVSRPIVGLAGRLRRMAPGAAEQLSVPPGHENDEIGALVEGANVLLQTNRAALQSERELRAEIEKMEAQYRQIFDASSAGIFVLSSDRHLVNCNPTALRLLGLHSSDMKQLQSADLLRMTFARHEHVAHLMNESLRQGVAMEDDLEVIGGAAGPRWVHGRISVKQSGAERWIEGVIYDITERKRAEEAARHQAEHDALTGLRNRRASDAAIDRSLAEAAALDRCVSVLYIDLDGFKRINDEHGHKAGDQVLIQCAQRLRQALRRSSDMAGRIGGDEFLAVLPGVGPCDAALGQVAQAILAALSEPIALDSGTVVRVGASIGIACFPRHGRGRKALLHAADEAMYQVKRSGKNAFALACSEGAALDA